MINLSLNRFPFLFQELVLINLLSLIKSMSYLIINKTTDKFAIICFSISSCMIKLLITSYVYSLWNR